MVAKLTMFENDSDFPLGYLIDAGVLILVRVGRWPSRRYALKITDPSTFEGAEIRSDQRGVQVFR